MSTALVTGAAKRIGREIVLSLANDGYNIALHYNLSSPDALVAEIKSLPGSVQCVAFKCDFADFSALSSLIPAVFEEFSDLDLLINNASIFEPATILETTEARFDSHFNINFKAPFFLSRGFVQNLEKGTIINILDTKIKGNNSPYAAYLLSKKTLADFTLMAAREFAPKFRVNAIAPGFILPHGDKDQAYFDRLIQKIPLKKRGGAQDITKAVSFLLESDFITGETIFIDGGESLK